MIHSGHPDSALFLLDSLNLSYFSTEVSRAWYALLLTQAKDKNYIPHTDDSLIRRAVDYFDASDDILQRAKAHYYWGRVYQDKGEVENTVREFLTAMPLVEQADNYELNVLLKSNLGLLFWENGLQKEADSLYQRAVELAEARRDTSRLIVALLKRADICMEKGEDYYCDADDKISRALELANLFGDQHAKEIVYSSLSYLREYQGRAREAIVWAHKGLNYVPDNSAEKGYYLILGSAYTQLGIHDSATIYLQQSLDTDNYYTKASAYMRLSEVASCLGNQNKALEYETLYGIYKDSMKLVEQPVEVISSFKNILYHQSVKRYHFFLIQYRFYLLLIGSLLFITICFYLYRRKKKNVELEELKTRHHSLYLGIESLKTDLLQKELEIESLQEHCKELEEDTNQRKEFDNYLKELIEQYRQIQENLEKQVKERNDEIIKLRSLNLKSALSSSVIYKKLLELCKYNSQNPDGIKKISSQDWNVLIQEIDAISLGFVERLQNKYEYLLEDDIHFCCLVKLEFKYSDIASIWGCSAVAVHKRSRTILERMGVLDYKNIKLLDVLNQV